VHGTAFDKRPHDHDEGHAHENHQIPVIDNPLGHRLQGLPVEQQILQPHQRSICIHGSTLEEHIAVALEVVARRTWLQTYATLLDVIFIRKLAGAATSGGVIAILTGQVAQLALIHVWQRGRGEETLGHVPQQTWRSTAFTPNDGNVMDPLLINDIAANRLDVGLLLAAAATAVGLLRLLRL